MKAGQYVAAPTQERDEPRKPCKRSCCWSPYGHAPREGCTCHRSDS